MCAELASLDRQFVYLMTSNSLRSNWDGKARDWHRHIGAHGDRNRRLRLKPTTKRWVGNLERCRVLDAGCGTGWMAGLLAGAGADVTAIDFSEEMVRVAQHSFHERGLEVAVRVDDCTTLQRCCITSARRLVRRSGEDRVPGEIAIRSG